MLKFILWYFTIGFIWWIATTIGMTIIYGRRFGLHIFGEACDNLIKRNDRLISGDSESRKRLNWAFNIIVWPMGAVIQMPWKLKVLWNNCKELAGEGS